MNADDQSLTGDVTADSISTVALDLSNASSLTGAIDTANTGKFVSLTLNTKSIWNVTADSYLSALSDSDTSLSNIRDNGHNIYYDSSVAANSWLGGQTITLSGGGKLIPVTN
ncbi:hypothetical protein D3C73_1094990 [compost metagenome]